MSDPSDEYTRLVVWFYDDAASREPDPNRVPAYIDRHLENNFVNLKVLGPDGKIFHRSNVPYSPPLMSETHAYWREMSEHDLKETKRQYGTFWRVR